jgi:dihydrofolate reductase
MSVVALVYAISQNGIIGKHGGLPWHIPSDLKWFKAVTLGKPVIMGRKTWDSLPRKPLPGRKNIVISRRGDIQFEGAETAADLNSALAIAELEKPDEVCVIGGAEIYQLFLPLAQKIYLTRILADVEGDTRMAELDPKQWREVERQAQPRGEKDSAVFETVIYQRR